MFMVSLITSRAVSVLLGGSGVSQRAPRVNRDVGVLLSPRKPETARHAAGPVSAASVDSRMWQPFRHD
jgi:hypothetical protein